MDTSIRGAGIVRILLAVFSIGVAASSGRAATIIVPDDNSSLVAAVAGAAPGDTIQVRPGTYTEGSAVEVRADGVTIEGLGGRPLLTGANRKLGFRAQGVQSLVIAGFDIQGRVGAVLLDDCSNCIVADLVVTDCDAGIRVRRGAHNAIFANTLTNITHHEAIIVEFSSVFVADNTVIGGNKDGIRLFYLQPDPLQTQTQIFGNIVTGVRRRGIVLTHSPGAGIESNIVSSSGREGVKVIGNTSPDLVLTNNTAAQNRREGFSMTSVNATLSDNVAMGNGGDGFKISRTLSSPITITLNDATDNQGYGFNVAHLSQTDLLASGNTATGNLKGDFH